MCIIRRINRNENIILKYQLIHKLKGQQLVFKRYCPNFEKLGVTTQIQQKVVLAPCNSNEYSVLSFLVHHNLYLY